VNKAPDCQWYNLLVSLASAICVTVVSRPRASPRDQPINAESLLCCHSPSVGANSDTVSLRTGECRAKTSLCQWRKRGRIVRERAEGLK
jgi:hypothetical protein